MQPEPRDLWTALVTFRHRVMDQMQDGLAQMTELDLSLPQGIALAQIAEAGPMTVSTLQARMKRSQATTSHLVSQLQRKGLVERGDDPEDARRTVVRLSKKGARFTERLDAVRRRGFERVLSRLPVEVRSQLETALRATLSALETTE
jgi:DNA-binding MarR family transcriptional regulator